MQFACESCKAQLQIADEKVRGKRLIVRCKRCGAKIGISDPALKAKPRPAPAAPMPAAAAAAPSVAGPQVAHPATDTESTRAMDSDMLEKALEASKTDDPSKMNGAPAPAQGGEWFAMIHGKQTGPMTRAELTTKTNDGAVGPRTYLWKEGMESWQRAKDLPELSTLFPQLPEAAPPPPVATVPAMREFSTPEFVTPFEKAAPPPAEKPREPEPPPVGDEEPLELATERVAKDQNAEDLARWASEELARKSNPAMPRAAPAPSSPRMFEGASQSQSRSPIGIIIVLAVLAAAAAVLWFTLGSTPPPLAPTPASEKKDAVALPAKPEPAAEKPAPPPAETKPIEKTPEKPTTGLTADQVRKKLDENKAALQGCIDEALRRDPNLRVGKIHIATTIAPSGQVTSARIDKSNVEQSRLGACLRQVTRKISFPSFPGDAFDVDIPIVVTAGD